MIDIFPSGKRYCRIHKLTFISDGNCPKCEKSHVPEFNEDLRGFNEDLRRVSVPRKYVQGGFLERLHAYGLRFEAVVDWDLVPGSGILLGRGVYYKRLDFDYAFVNVFRRSIVVRLKKNNDIEHSNIRVAEKLAQERVYAILGLLPCAIKVSVSSLNSVHNAFIDHPIAKQFNNLKVYDDQGELRAWTDNSHDKHEFEFGSSVYAVSDSEWRESFEADLLRRPEFLSVQQSKINKVVDVLDKYAFQMDKHLEVEQKTSDTLSLIQQSLSHSVVSPGGFSSPLFPSGVLSSCPSRHSSLAESPSLSSFACLDLTISRYDSDEVVKVKRDAFKRLRISRFKEGL